MIVENDENHKIQGLKKGNCLELGEIWTENRIELPLFLCNTIFCNSMSSKGNDLSIKTQRSIVRIQIIF